MSKQKIYKQLISEYGEKFTEEEAQYAIDTLQADYKANALEKAKSYRDTMNMSKAPPRNRSAHAYPGRISFRRGIARPGKTAFLSVRTHGIGTNRIGNFYPVFFLPLVFIVMKPFLNSGLDFLQGKGLEFFLGKTG